MKLLLQPIVKDLLIYSDFPTPFNFCYNIIMNYPSLNKSCLHAPSSFIFSFLI